MVLLKWLCNTVYNYDLIAPETYLNSSFTNETVCLTGFSQEVRCNYPDDVKRGRVCLFYKDNLAIKTEERSASYG